MKEQDLFDNNGIDNRYYDAYMTLLKFLASISFIDNVDRYYQGRENNIGTFLFIVTSLTVLNIANKLSIFPLKNELSNNNSQIPLFNKQEYMVYIPQLDKISQDAMLENLNPEEFIVFAQQAIE